MKILLKFLLIFMICYNGERHLANGLKCWKCKPEGECDKDRTGNPVDCNNGICFTQEVRELYEGYSIHKDCDTSRIAAGMKTGTCDFSRPEMTKCYCKNADNCNQHRIELVNENGEEIVTEGPISSSGILRSGLIFGVFEIGLLTLVN